MIMIVMDKILIKTLLNTHLTSSSSASTGEMEMDKIGDDTV